MLFLVQGIISLNVYIGSCSANSAKPKTLRLVSADTKEHAEEKFKNYFEKQTKENCAFGYTASNIEVFEMIGG